MCTSTCIDVVCSEIITSCLLNFQVFASSADGSIRAWDVKSGTCRKLFKGHTYPINCMQVSASIMIVVIL